MEGKAVSENPPRMCYICDRTTTPNRDSQGTPVCYICKEQHLSPKEKVTEIGEMEKRESKSRDKTEEKSRFQLEIDEIELDWDEEENTTPVMGSGPVNPNKMKP